MTLLDKLKEDLLTARKCGDVIAKGCLNPLISDCEAVGKKNLRQVNDNEVIEVIKSYIKRLNIALDSYKSETGASKAWVEEIEILEGYLPSQLGEVEIEFIIKDCIDNGMNNIGQIMKYFKEEYNGRYNAGVVSKTIKRVI